MECELCLSKLLKKTRSLSSCVRSAGCVIISNLVRGKKSLPLIKK